MDRRVKPERDDLFSEPEESSIIDDVPNLPNPDISVRRKPSGPKPGKETPGGWRR